MADEENKTPKTAKSKSSKPSHSHKHKRFCCKRKKKIKNIFLGKPVEEIDPFVFDDTYCVISKKFGKHYIYRFSSTRSLFMFGPLNPIRKIATRFISSQMYDSLIILIILSNCITLGLVTNWEVGTTGIMYRNTEVEDIVDYIEWICLGVYTMEMIVKVIAKGFVINKYSYLRNKWNMLDCFIVITSYFTNILELFGRDSLANFEFLPAIRVFRVIKTFSIFPGLRTMINALLSSVKQLIEVMALTLFCIMIFALLALELLMGTLKQKCVVIKGGYAHKIRVQKGTGDVSQLVPINPSDPYVHKDWFDWVSNEENWIKRKDEYPKDEFVPCSNNSWGRRCDRGHVCLPNIGENFDEGWTNFDSFPSSMLSIFQLVTLDFWERLYELVISSTNVNLVVFFIMVIFLGSYYLINLMLAVVAMSYEQEVTNSQMKSVGRTVKLSVHRHASTFSFDDPRKLDVVELTNFEKRTPEQREYIAKRLRKLSLVEKASQGSDIPPDPNAKPGANLHLAIMTLLGRRMSSMDSKEAESSDESSAKEDSVKLSTEIDGGSPTGEKVEAEKEGVDAHKSKSNNSDRMSIKAATFVFSNAAGSKKSHMVKAAPSRCNKFLKFLKTRLTPIVNSVAFEVLITSMIIINTIMLASEHHNQPDWLTRLLILGNHYFTFVFSVEAVLKIMALQEEYFASKWNIFDLLIVIMSVIDSAQDEFDGIRGMRILRVFKLAQSWITMKVLLTIIFSTFGSLANLVVVLLIVLYIFAVLGLQVVGKHYTKQAFDAVSNEDDFPRWNFQNFGYAFMMVFRVLCGEWIEPLWDCLKATNATHSDYKCFIIFFPCLVVGNFIVLNLFLALLLNSFDTEELNSQREKEREAAVQGKTENLKKIVGALSFHLRGKTLSIIRKWGESSTTLGSVWSEDGSSLAGGQGKERFKAVAGQVIQMNRSAVEKRMMDKSLKDKQQTASKNVSKANTLFIPRQSNFAVNKAHDDTNVSQTNGSESDTVVGCIPQKCWAINCGCFAWLRQRRNSCGGWKTFRHGALRIVSHPMFEWVILGLIFASSTTLCFEDVHLEDRKTLKEALFVLNTIFTFIFILEMILKWFAVGLWRYCTDAWTILDLVIVVVSIIQMVVDFNERILNGGTFNAGGRLPRNAKRDLAALKALRTLRALRPLRAISRWQGMKIVVNALMYAIPSIFNVLVVCLLFWLIFAIMGVQFFKGKFYKCVDNADGEIVSSLIVANREECCSNTNEWSWINTQPNFDNVFQAYLTLFQVVHSFHFLYKYKLQSNEFDTYTFVFGLWVVFFLDVGVVWNGQATFEGWMEAFQASVDSTEINVQPTRDNILKYYIFYVIFIMFGAFFTLNLIIGVIIDNFNRLKKKYEGNLVGAFLTPSQRQYYTAMRQLSRKKPRKVIRRPKHNFLALFYDISMSRRFEIAIFGIIFVHMTIMGFETHNQRLVITNILSGFNSFFTAIYGIEAVVKIIGLRQYYFTVPWNLFDFVLVIASCVDLAVGEESNLFLIPPTMLRIVRVFRIGRVLRLIKAAKGIRKLLFALIVSLPALFNIGALLFLITFIYAILGMALFGKIEKSEAVDEVFNFDTFLRSCLMLLRLMTAAGWNDVLLSMTPETPLCGSYRNIPCGRPGEGECANVGLAVAYLVSYLFISYLIVINMYIAIILENFIQANLEEEVGVVEDDLEMFYVQWSRYDPQATQFISFDQLSEFVASLDPPLGLPKPNIVAIVAFNLPIAKGNKLHCLDILHALVKHVIGHVDDSEEFRKLQEQLEHDFRKQFPTRKLLEIISSTRIWKIQHNAAITIQRAWRAYRLRKYGPREKSSKRTLASTNTHHRGEHTTVLKTMGNLLHVGPPTHS